ncbi:UDP-glucose:sterol glycosyltransferase [Coprinopsis cinerea okayama7|uniref:Sterol 3-beta-glucosyltransferase n=1 Tax=Coprinopsis cinerea (strain Okayama-7 / 130 / ATCC MYA-4618 / FGSC 9003) TaxID=240176 RepID=A8N292_COPC7|nr:UDP-glucose:sterol glycosyltransferase [Coprinopsis cinerea okayama7\|eukprot:XP_001829011.2 UDP-glucose:sterol glycosyltransferase [Coprinopsis cinerea okayama7\
MPSVTDDSPFITPPSPPLRPSSTPFRGDGSMRAGTQTLIQALQALPWMMNEVDEDSAVNDVSQSEPESSDDDRPGFKRLSSSIHAIYRPLARSRRMSIPIPRRRKDRNTSQPLEEETSSALSSESEDDAEADFEEQPPQPPHSRPTPLQHQSLPPLTITDKSVAQFRPLYDRTAEKLREIFELEGIQEKCHAGYYDLSGYMYLTNDYLCFFAHMPVREDQVLKSGSLSKKAQRTKRWIKHWFILKNDALSWYQSSSDPYFPHGILDLRYAISCEAIGEREFRIRTTQKSVTLSADSVPSRDEWVKSVKKVIFKAQNSGDNVKIAIPYSVVLDVELSTAMDFSETIEVKVVDKDDQYSLDSYFFAYFHDMPAALEQIRDAIRTHRAIPEHSQEKTVLDTTVTRSPPPSALERPSTIASDSVVPKSTSGFRLSSILKPFSDTISLTRASTASESESQCSNEEFTYISQRGPSSFVPVTTSPKSITPQEQLASQPGPSSQSLPNPDHTYPPSTFSSSIHPDMSSLTRESTSLWNVGVPSWLKPTRRVFGSFASSESTPTSYGSMAVKEVYSSPAPSAQGSSLSRMTGGDLAYSVLEAPAASIDQDVVDKFRTAFAYDEKETLLGYFPGYIFRLLPVFGRLYVSTNFFCFKSSGPLAVRTRMTLPIRDIVATEKTKATRFGHHGLIIIVKGHEELFFEFGAADKRDAFVRLLEKQMDDVRARLAVGETLEPSSEKREALALEAFDSKTSASSDSDPAPPPDNMSDSLPAVMFTSASSTFLTFKPPKPLHFTFLTIGSRGDVQPYIALAKGLIADGHKVRIATHGEFQEWIESYGIEYGCVGGDPAELMRICVENGMFTVSFLKETLQKFRGWLDDLLQTSWEACQGTDILIESPSAMGGYHIAEALGIPYFRAFTMTWSRTRAYPHAFAVPERKMGGSYNYMSYVMFDQVFWRATAGQINRWRRHTLGLGATSLDRMEPHKIPFLYNFSPTVVPPPLDWPEWIRITGYWFLDDADVGSKKWTPPDSLVEFIDNAHQSGKKVVYIGFGSIVVSDPRSMTKCVIDAVVQSGVHAILSKGWSDRLHVKLADASEPEEPLPPQIYPITSAPHDWLFARIDAACHHGGAGTTGASLRAGVPTIIHPFFGDQFFWADRVEALGVGTGVRKLTVSALKDALVSATTDQKQIDRAKLVGEQIRRVHFLLDPGPFSSLTLEHRRTAWLLP